MANHQHNGNNNNNSNNNTKLFGDENKKTNNLFSAANKLIKSHAEPTKSGNGRLGLGFQSDATTAAAKSSIAATAPANKPLLVATATTNKSSIAAATPITNSSTATTSIKNSSPAGALPSINSTATTAMSKVTHNNNSSNNNKGTPIEVLIEKERKDSCLVLPRGDQPLKGRLVIGSVKWVLLLLLLFLLLIMSLILISLVLTTSEKWKEEIRRRNEEENSRKEDERRPEEKEQEERQPRTMELIENPVLMIDRTKELFSSNPADFILAEKMKEIQDLILNHIKTDKMQAKQLDKFEENLERIGEKLLNVTETAENVFRVQHFQSSQKSAKREKLDCPNFSYIPHSGLKKCYLFVGLSKDWREAQNYCQSEGGILAEPKTSSENSFLISEMRHWMSTESWWLGARRRSSADAGGVRRRSSADAANVRRRRSADAEDRLPNPAPLLERDYSSYERNRNAGETEILLKWDSDGTKLEFDNFDKRQQEQRIGGCLIYYNYDRVWTSVDCNSSRKFVCQADFISNEP